jgi:hypothetical protein
MVAECKRPAEVATACGEAAAVPVLRAIQTSDQLIRPQVEAAERLDAKLGHSSPISARGRHAA